MNTRYLFNKFTTINTKRMNFMMSDEFNLF